MASLPERGFEGRPVAKLDESAWSRGWRDARTVIRWPWVQIGAALITGTFAVLGALLPEDAPVGLTVATTLLGTFGGLLVVGLILFAVLVACAPVRQRDEARAELERVTGADDDPVELEREFSAWLRAMKAALPDPPRAPAILPSDEGFAEVAVADELAHQRYQHDRSEVERQARVEYHDRFRVRMVAILGDVAENPGRLHDLERLRRALIRSLEDALDRVMLLDRAHQLGLRLRERIVIGGGIPASDDAPEDPADRVKQAVIAWANDVWSLLERRFSGHADEFFGPHSKGLRGVGFFGNACGEIRRLGSAEEYLNRKLAFVAALLRKYDR